PRSGPVPLSLSPSQYRLVVRGEWIAPAAKARADFDELESPRATGSMQSGWPTVSEFAAVTATHQYSAHSREGGSSARCTLVPAFVEAGGGAPILLAHRPTL